MSGPADGRWPGEGVNPYAAPAAAVRGAAGAATDSAAGPGMVRHVLPVAILMIVQGALELLISLIFLALVVAVPLMIPDLPAGPAENFGGPPPLAFLKPMMMAVYGVMATGGLLAGVMHVAAGIFGLRFRRRMLGIVALALGMASVTTVYCAPTAVGLAIYGLITYCNPAVVAAFALGEQGLPAAEIRSRFGG